MALKDYFQKDLDNIFFNCNEFALENSINGETKEIIIDDDELKEFNTKNEGIFQGDILFFIRKNDIDKPIVNQRIIFDNDIYSIVSVKEVKSMYEVVIKGVMS